MRKENLIFSNNTYVVGTQRNHLNETFLEHRKNVLKLMGNTILTVLRLTLYILLDSSIWFDTIHIGLVHFHYQWPQTRLSKLGYFFYSMKIVLSWGAVLTRINITLCGILSDPSLFVKVYVLNTYLVSIFKRFIDSQYTQTLKPMQFCVSFILVSISRECNR